jgi:hypothetical protein
MSFEVIGRGISRYTRETIARVYAPFSSTVDVVSTAYQSTRNGVIWGYNIAANAYNSTTTAIGNGFAAIGNGFAVIGNGY